VKLALGVIKLFKSSVILAQDLDTQLKSAYSISQAQLQLQTSIHSEPLYTFNTSLTVSYHTVHSDGLEGAEEAFCIVLLSTYFLLAAWQVSVGVSGTTICVQVLLTIAQLDVH
jgi:hypothetical protein